MVAFDYSKESFATEELGAVNGLINVGGFLAALSMMWIVGISLDTLGGLNLYSMENFRVAFSWQLLITALGIAGLVFSGRRVRNKERV